ncbi:hypothetical protein HDU82_004639 [Entophlyctis luteolus]|nr:hypothetical protein HDU82_004639 [Entophlyctis luteolus]
MSSPIAPPTLLSCASADERDAWVDALTRLCGIEVSKSNSLPPLPNPVVEISRRNNLETHQLSRELETANARIKELEDGDRVQAQIQEAKKLSCGRKDEKEIASYSSVDIHNLIDVKFSQIMEAIWAANTTRANSAEVVKTHATNQEPNATAIENALIDLTESMELRTSRIGKMVHEIASWKEQIMAIPAMSENLATSRSGLDNLAHEVATLLAVAAENSVSDRIMRDEHLKIVKENHSELLKWTEILQKENLIPLTEQIDHIVKTIESVEVAQSKVSGILSKIPQTIKEENRPSEDIVREAEQALDIEPANIRAMSSILLESLADLEGQISRSAREASSKQDLIEIWMNRITDTLKMIQQGIHAVERIERKATAINPDCGKANIGSIEIFEGKIESILKNWDKKGTEQFDLAMQDIKETWSKKSARISEDIEDLLKDKAQLSHEISELRKERNGLEEDIAALRRQKDEMGSIAQLSSAVSALERDLEGRIYGLLDEIEILKQTKTELINAN